MEQGQHHPPEDVCWVQPTDSLAFSVSPVGPSTSNSARGGGSNSNADEDNFFKKSRDEETTDEDRPLMGEHIWDRGGGGGGSCGALDDEREAEAPPLRICERSRRSTDDQGLVSVPGGPPSPPQNGTHDERSGSSDPALYAMGRWGPPQHDEDGEDERSLGSPRGMDEDTYSNHGISDSESEEGPQRHEQRALDEFPRQDEWGALDQGGRWADGDDEEDLAPAWDEGRSAESDGDGSDNSQLGRSDRLDAGGASREQSQSYEAASEFYVGDNDDRGTDATYYSGNEAVAVVVEPSLVGRVVEPSLVGRESLSPVTRRRTRSSLDRERRRLDRVPRSQRLNQVKGHPLGGMTLLELEERHLLDVGIGQMTRRLENRRAGGVRRPDADLLRRSARLLRRAQEDRDARSFFEDKYDGFRTHGTPSRSRGRTRGAGPRGGGGGQSRRPASASRDRRQPISNTSLFLQSEENLAWARGSEHGQTRVDGRRCTAAGDPLVGLYSGGGARCSLQQRRPMSAKPALTCGSGWEPGRTRVRDSAEERHGCEDARGGDAEGASRARAGRLEGGYGGSDMSDLSPQGIVEYTDEEEGPFNVDELERVAASYLLRPSGSMYHSSLTVADDRFADDGSVYIYREESGSSPDDARENEGEECSGGSEEDRSCRNRATLACDVERDQRSRWGEDVGEVSTSAVITGSSNSRDRHRAAPDGYHTGISYERSVIGVNVVPGEPSAGRGGGGDAAAGTHHKDILSAEEGQMLQQPHESSDARQASASGASGGDFQIRGEYAPHGQRPGKGTNPTLIDECGSRPDRGRREDVSPETLDAVPGARVSRSARRDGVPREESGGSTATASGPQVERIAAGLRGMILDRQVSAGRSIRQVFGHFDRRRCGYVNVSEMRDALADLRLNVSPDQAKAIHARIALDGGDRLSYAEFAVFVSDPRHSELQAHVCQQAAKQLEGLGRRSFNLDAAFHPARLDTAALSSGGRPKSAAARPAREEHHGTRHEKSRRADDAAAGRAGERPDGGDARKIISTSEFLAGLEALGLGLSTSDAQRLVVRFDVHGDGYLSAGRFVAMVESSSPWTRALERLAQQEEADEEADAYLRAQRVYGRCSGGGAVSAEIVEMARYIGIRVSSDSSLLWIAADALVAPLPEGWVMYKGQEGRWFYHNELTGHSRWDHPLDPHFRSVYLRERFGASHAEEETGCEDTSRSQGVARPNLPPRRNRPNVLDFPADKALENLRSRRLDSSIVGRSAVAMGAPTVPVVVSPTNAAAAARTGSEPWTNRGGVPAAPLVPRRRRPVSASALRDGIQENGLGAKAAAGGARPNRVGRGVGSTEMAEVLYSGSRVDPTRAERGPGGRPRRPCSARAALQRPPSDRQPPQDTRRGERYDDRHVPGVAVNEKSPHSGQASAVSLGDERCVAQGLGNEQARAKTDDRGSQSQPDGEEGVPRDTGGRTRRPEGRPIATSFERPQPDRAVADVPTAAEKERAWLRSRLTELCGKLDEAEMLSRSDSQRSSVSRDARGSGARGAESRQDLSRSLEFEEVGAVSEDLGRQAMSGKHSPKAVDMLSPSEEGSPPSGIGSHLKDQVVELTNRMRYLETLLHDPHRHRDLRDHPQRSHSFSSARGAVALARTAARARQRDGAKSGHGGGGGGGGSGSGGGGGGGGSSSNKRASQDDWANNLSKRSWSPPTGTADSRRVALQSHSCGGSSGSLLCPVEEVAAANHVARWEGLTPNQASRRRRNSGGGGKVVTGRSSSGRVARDSPPGGIVLI